jgi:hypothetical protein
VADGVSGQWRGMLTAALFTGSLDKKKLRKEKANAGPRVNVFAHYSDVF